MYKLLIKIVIGLFAVQAFSLAPERSSGGELPLRDIRFSCFAKKDDVLHTFNVMALENSKGFTIQYMKLKNKHVDELIGPLNAIESVSVYPNTAIELNYKSYKKYGGHMLQVAIAVEDRIIKGKFKDAYPARMWRDSSPQMAPEPIEFYKGYCFTNKQIR